MLQLPATIRAARAEDFPHREDIVELLEKRNMATIEEGFIIRPNKTPQLPFSFTADININNNRLWQLFTALAADMPAEVCCVYGLCGEGPVVTGYIPVAQAIAAYARFENEVTMDCSMEFGLRYHTREMLAELFITESKYLKFSGSGKEKFLQRMQQFNVKEIRWMAFVDEYPKVVVPLKDVLPLARRPADVIWSLNRAFGVEG